MCKLLLLLLFIASSTFATPSGVSLFDIKEYRKLASYFEKNIQTLTDNRDLTLQDVFYQDNETFLTFSIESERSYLFNIFRYDRANNKLYRMSNIQLKETDFYIETDLAGRQVKFIDRSPYKLLMLFPITPGSINVRRDQLTTPQIKKAYIDKRAIISKRVDPEYYKGYPFLRITTNVDYEKGWTPIAFHILMEDKMNRSPDSHGCMRLRARDLMSAFFITRYGPKLRTPISIHLRVAKSEEEIHPYPLNNKSYKREKNFGTKKYPATERGEDDLTILESIRGSADLVVKKMNERYLDPDSTAHLDNNFLYDSLETHPIQF